MMKFHLVFLASTLVLSTGLPLSLQAQTSQDLLINDTAEDYQRGYEAGKAAASNGSTPQPAATNSQAYLDGYGDGYTSSTQVRSELTVELNPEKVCTDRVERSTSDVGETNPEFESGVGFNVDLNTGQTHCLK